MTIDEHIREFAGLPVVDFEPGAAPPADPGAVAWRLGVDFDEYSDDEDAFARKFDALQQAEWVGRIAALVIGRWGEPYDSDAPTEEVAAAAGAFSGLRALFVGELTAEESEISWIMQGDATRLLTAYPRLEVLRLRGGGPALTPLRHEGLRELAFESGGLPGEVIRAVGECDLPNLHHLELWLGTEQYHGDSTVDDLAAVLAGGRLPALTYLGLRDAEIADEVAAALATAPVVARLETLDLSLGVLSDTGAASLLAGQPLTHLRLLDLHHHYLSEAMTARLHAALDPAGVRVDDSDRQQPDRDGDRYVAVSE